MVKANAVKTKQSPLSETTSEDEEEDLESPDMNHMIQELYFKIKGQEKAQNPRKM